MNESSIVAKKKELRKAMFSKRASLKPSLKLDLDNNINQQLFDIITAQKAQIIHSYLPMGAEVAIFPLIQKLLDLGITVVCPKTLPKRKLEHRVLKSLNELEEGIMKTFHPKEPEIFDGKCDVIIVPGLAYDSLKYRVGYGGGYYDGFLADQPHALKVGVFYSFQEVESVPKEAHDLCLDRIVTA